MNPEFSPPQYGWGRLFFFRSGSGPGEGLLKCGPLGARSVPQGVPEKGGWP